MTNPIRTASMKSGTRGRKLGPRYMEFNIRVYPSMGYQVVVTRLLRPAHAFKSRARAVPGRG
jgi:hypothetical protein